MVVFKSSKKRHTITILVPARSAQLGWRNKGYFDEGGGVRTLTDDKDEEVFFTQERREARGPRVRWVK